MPQWTAAGPLPIHRPTREGRADAPASFLFGSASGSLSLFGGTVLLGGNIAAVPVLLDGDGAFSVTTPIPLVPGFAGTTVYTQFAVADPGAERGVAFSAGLATNIQ